MLLRDELREGTHLTDSLRDDLLRAINDRRAERARNDRLLRVLLGPRYAYIAAHAPHLLTDVRAADDHIDNDPDDRHARVDVQDFGFVADEFPHFLALLDDGPLARYTLHWAGLWSPSDDTGYSNESTWIVDLLDLRTGEIVECNDAAACTAAWPDLAAFHRHPYARTNPPPPGEMTLADVRAALMITTRADGWTGLSIDQGSVTGHYSFYLEGYSERAPHAYDFPCVSLRECRLVLEGGADEWEQQWLRSQEDCAPGNVSVTLVSWLCPAGCFSPTARTRRIRRIRALRVRHTHPRKDLLDFCPDSQPSRALAASHLQDPYSGYATTILSSGR